VGKRSGEEVARGSGRRLPWKGRSIRLGAAVRRAECGQATMNLSSAQFPKVCRWLALGMALLAAAPTSAYARQEQPKEQKPSVAEAARRAREQKKDAPRARVIWTNDNLPSAPQAAVNVVGAPRAAEPAGAGTGQPPAEASAAREAERARVEAELESAKAELAQAQRRLDLTRRELQLQRQQFFSNPQYQTDDAGRARLQQLEAQEQEQAAAVVALEQRIAELDERRRALEAELGPKAPPPTTPEQQREAWRKRLEPLRAELARVESELRRLREEAAARGFELVGPGAGGSMTAQLLADLEQRRNQLRQQIAEIEEEARRAGVPPAWIR